MNDVTKEVRMRTKPVCAGHRKLATEYLSECAFRRFGRICTKSKRSGNQLEPME